MGRGAPTGGGHAQQRAVPPADYAVYGGQTVLGFTNAFRAEVGVFVGDAVQVELDRDEAPREVEVPPDLRAALDGDAEARAIYDKLSFTHRREFWPVGGRGQARGDPRAPRRQGDRDAARGETR